MPALETATLAAEVASLAVELWKAVRNASAISFGGGKYKFLNSLTTLELLQDGDRQLTHFVQDRTVKFLRKDTMLPKFVYGTQGKDTIEHLKIDGALASFRSTAERPDTNWVGAEEEILYEKNRTVRATLIARSEGGFPTPHEFYEMTVRDFSDAATLFVIFPKDRPPRNIYFRYRRKGDQENQWRPLAPSTREKHEERDFTGGRRAYIVELRNPKLGNTYRLTWDW